MIEPMLARLAGCLVFAGLTGGLLVAVAAPADATKRDVVAAAEIKERVETALVTRP
jgi:hypothetical protein